MADNTTGMPVQTITGQFVSTKIVDSGGTNVAAVSAAGALSGNITAYGGTATTLGQKAMSASIPVTIASDQGSFTVAITANSAVNVAQYGGSNVVTGGVAGTVGVGGLAAHDATISGNPVYMGAKSSAAAPTDVTADGEAVGLWALRNGSQVVNIAAGGTLWTNMGQAAASGQFVRITDGTLTATVRDTGATDALNVAIVDAAGSQVTSFGGGTQYAEDAALGANGTGTLMIARRDDALTTLTPVADDAVGLRVGDKGALWVQISDGSGNQVTSFGGGTQYVGDAAATATPTGTMAMALANAAAPTDVNANADAVAVWALRNGSQVVNLAVGGTLITNLGQAAANRMYQQITDGTNSASVIATINALKTDVSSIAGAVPAATNPMPVRLTNGTSFLANLGEAAASGQYVRLTDGTDTAEVIGTINSLKVDVASIVGAVPAATNPIPVRLTDGAAFYSSASAAPTDPKFSTQTSSALGAGASATLTHYVTSGKTGQLIGVDAGSTVPCKVVINTVLTGTPTGRVVLFTQPYQVYQWRAPFKTFITRASADATSGFSVTFTNKDASVAADVYSTAYWDEV